MIFVLIFVALTFVCIAAFQFLYLFYLERVEIEHKQKIRELERRCKELSNKVTLLESQLEEIDDFSDDEEVWADVIGEH
jgi:uncharacterized membrane protein